MYRIRQIDKLRLRHDSLDLNATRLCNNERIKHRAQWRNSLLYLYLYIYFPVSLSLSLFLALAFSERVAKVSSNFHNSPWRPSNRLGDELPGLPGYALTLAVAAESTRYIFQTQK